MLRMKILFTSLLMTIAGTVFSTASGDGGWKFDEAPVGQVLVLGSRTECDGTLVGADVVMTVAHCIIPVGETEAVDASEVRFSMADSDGFVRVFEVEDVAYPEGFEHMEVPTRKQISQDVALLKLTEFASEVSDDISLVDPSASYVALLPARETDVFEGEPCEVTYEENGLMVLECARDRGASGGPVYSMIGGSRKLVGLISADGKTSEGSVVFAVNPMGVLDRLEWVSEKRARITDQ